MIDTIVSILTGIFAIGFFLLCCLVILWIGNSQYGVYIGVAIVLLVAGYFVGDAIRKN